MEWWRAQAAGKGSSQLGLGLNSALVGFPKVWIWPHILEGYNGCWAPLLPCLPRGSFVGIPLLKEGAVYLKHASLRVKTQPCTTDAAISQEREETQLRAATYS